MSFKLVLKGFMLKKLVVEPKNAQPVEAMANRLNRLRNRSTGCARPIEVWLRETQNFLSLPVAFFSWSRSGQALTVTCQAFNANG